MSAPRRDVGPAGPTDAAATADVDAPLVAALRRREPRAFETAYARYRARIYGFLVRLSRDRDLADELFQETFVRLAENAHRLHADTNLRAYLYTVARNLYLANRRRSLFRLGRLRELFFGKTAAVAAGLHRDGAPQQSLERDELLRKLELGLSELSDPSREALLLTAVEGLSTEAAAAVVGILPAAFRKRQSRARLELKNRLERHGVTIAEALHGGLDAD